MLHDLQSAVRVACRTPLITAAAVLSLALAIAANTTVFSLLKSLTLAPLPYPNVDRLAAISETRPAPDWSDLAVSTPNLADFRAHAQSFERLAAFRGHSFMVTLPARTEVLPVGHIDADFLPLFGASPTLGRLFTDADLAPGRPALAVISERLWRSAFAGDPQVIGRTLPIHGQPFTIAGVTSFQYLYDHDYDIWVPITHDPDPEPSRTFDVYGLLKPGVSPALAQVDLNRGLHGSAVRVASLAEDYRGSARRLVYLLQIAVGFVLLIACANTSHLLAGSAARRRELGMRIALGASKFRLLRECLVESALLAALGGAAGLAVATRSLELARRFAPLPRVDSVTLDLESLAAAFLFTSFAALICGLTPVLRTTEVSVSEGLCGPVRCCRSRYPQPLDPRHPRRCPDLPRLRPAVGRRLLDDLFPLPLRRRHGRELCRPGRRAPELTFSQWSIVKKRPVSPPHLNFYNRFTSSIPFSG